MSVVHFATRTLLLNGVEYQPGAVVPVESLSRHRFKQLVALRVLRGEPVVEAKVVKAQPVSDEEPVEPVIKPASLTKARGGALLAKLRQQQRAAQ